MHLCVDHMSGSSAALPLDRVRASQDTARIGEHYTKNQRRKAYRQASLGWIEFSIYTKQVFLDA